MCILDRAADEGMIRAVSLLVGEETTVADYGARVVFFFQAEDGIRDYKVTGVQTCALPIFVHSSSYEEVRGPEPARNPTRLGFCNTGLGITIAVQSIMEHCAPSGPGKASQFRSEERRVGKECRSRWSPYH